MKPACPMGRLRGAWLGLARWRQRAVLALLALLLVQAQGLGLWHRVAHGGAPVPAAAVSAAVSAAVAVAVSAAPVSLHRHQGHHAQDHDAHHAHHANHAHPAFGHEPDDETGCRLFDQLAAADALLAAPALGAAACAPLLADAAVSSCTAGRARRPYQARAPPLA